MKLSVLLGNNQGQVVVEVPEIKSSREEPRKPVSHIWNTITVHRVSHGSNPQMLHVKKPVSPAKCQVYSHQPPQHRQFQLCLSHSRLLKSIFRVTGKFDPRVKSINEQELPYFEEGIRLKMEIWNYQHLGLKDKKRPARKAETREVKGDIEENSAKPWEGRVLRQRKHFIQVSQVLPRG